MRRVLLATLALFALAACEDGPTQTFNDAPGGAGGRWNDGNSPGVGGTASQGYGTQTGGNTAQEICTAPQLKAAWSVMLAAPIMPPRQGANIDMAGDDTWKGLTIEEAEKVNCQSTNVEVDGDEAYNVWGDQGEVAVEYSLTTRKIGYIGFDMGYTGAMDFKSRDGKTEFRFVNGNQIKAGPPGGALQPVTISWDNDPTTGVLTWATRFTDAIMASYLPALAAETDCLANGHCIIGNFGDQGYMFIPAIGYAFRVANINAPQPTPSTVSYMDQYLEKVLPFSTASPMLKLDSEGPIASALGLGPMKKNCKLVMGMTYGTMLSNCIQVTGDTTKDTSELNKLLGGISHGTERFSFDVSGIDLNFTDNGLADNDVIRDTDRPTPDDTATYFDVDQSALGNLLNDFAANDDSTGNQDFHGTGLVYAEFIRSVQNAINASLPAGQQHQLGDPACLTGDPSTFAAGCSGFEGFVVPLDPAVITDPNVKKLGVTPDNDAVANIVENGGLKPGHQKVVICDGPNQTKCVTTGDTFSTSFARLVSVLGKGSTANLPPDMQDSRFFFEKWATAYFKYMMVETPTGSATTDTVKNAPLDANALFFDSVGAGQFEISEYVDRRFVASSAEDPTDIQITADVKNGIFDDYEFSRDLFRGETAIYTAMRTDKTKPPGSENNVLISNIFGSNIIEGFWSDTATATAYECATGQKTSTDCGPDNGQPTDLNGNPLLDGNGQPLFTAYKDAFDNQSIFHLGNTAASPVKVQDTFPAIEQAMVAFDPDQTGSLTAKDVTFLVPWLPKQPGVGFPIAQSGTIDKFVSTYQLDFSGTTISANVDYDFLDPTHPDAGIVFLAVETTDFLGNIFMCRDGNSGDVLAIHMYTPVASILNWLQAHPGVSQDCGIIIRYSPYNNFPDYITSTTNGVRLGITQGGGFGRVVDVTLFVPGQ